MARTAVMDAVARKAEEAGTSSGANLVERANGGHCCSGGGCEDCSGAPTQVPNVTQSSRPMCMRCKEQLAVVTCLLVPHKVFLHTQSASKAKLRRFARSSLLYEAHEYWSRRTRLPQAAHVAGRSAPERSSVQNLCLYLGPWKG